MAIATTWNCKCTGYMIPSSVFISTENQLKSQLKYHIITDDFEWCYQQGENPGDFESDDDMDEEGNPKDFESESPNKGCEEISNTDLLQACVSSYMNSTFLAGKSRNVTVTEFEDV